MKIKHLFHVVLTLVGAMIITSCGSLGKSDDKTFDLIPIKIGKEESKISLIDLDGNIVLEDEFPSNSTIIVTNGVITEITGENGNVKYWVLEEKKLKQLGKEKYDAGMPFYEGYAVVRNEKGMLSLINKKGEETIPNLSKINNLNIVRVGVVSDGLIRFKDDKGAWGYLSPDGEIKVAAQFTSCEDFYKGKARVNKRNGAFAVIDKEGTEIFKGKSDFAYQMESEGLMGYGLQEGEGLWGFVNKEGEKVIKDTKFIEVGMFTNGLNAVRENEGDWGVIDKEGKFVGQLRAKYSTMPIVSSDGKVIINEDKEVKIFSNKGELLKEFDDYKSLIPIAKNRFLAKQSNDKYVIINEEGKELSNTDFLIAGDFEELINYGVNASSIRLLKNELSIESKYFEFETIYKDIFKSISLNGILGVGQSNTIESIINLFPNVSASGGSYIDKSDNFSFIMTHDLGGKKEDNTEEAIAADTTVVDDRDYSSADTTAAYQDDSYTNSTITDNYPYLSLYNNEYAPQEIYSSGFSYNLRFYFTDFLKLEIQGRDPVFTDMITTTGYRLNKAAKLQGVLITFSFTDLDSEIFFKEIINKINQAGFIKRSNGDFINSKNPNRYIRISDNYLYYSF